MKLFGQPTQVLQYENVSDFLKEFRITSKDFILATKSIYLKYFEEFNLPAAVAFKSDYGAGEPTDEMIDALLEDFAKSGCTRVIAVGGGAVLDMAKILVLKNGATADEFFEGKAMIEKRFPLIALPTTCGSGSEVSNVSIAQINHLNTKMGIASNALFPDYAVLIPDFIKDLPFDFFAASAIDAFIHAAESYLSPKASVYSRIFSQKAMEMLMKGFVEVSQRGEEAKIELAEDFLIGSNLAGIAFANAGTGMVHAMSYPLSGLYHVTHGKANYQFFTAVFKFYQKKKPKGDISGLVSALAGILSCRQSAVFDKIEEIFNTIMPKQPLKEFGMKPEDIQEFARIVTQTQQRLLGQSYVKPTEKQLEEIYTQLY